LRITNFTERGKKNISTFQIKNSLGLPVARFLEAKQNFFGRPVAEFSMAAKASSKSFKNFTVPKIAHSTPNSHHIFSKTNHKKTF
jgi:hypothetical protein